MAFQMESMTFRKQLKKSNSSDECAKVNSGRRVRSHSESRALCAALLGEDANQTPALTSLQSALKGNDFLLLLIN